MMHRSIVFRHLRAQDCGYGLATQITQSKNREHDPTQHLASRLPIALQGFSGDRMSGHYVISKRNDGWVIAVDGVPLLVCERRKVAVQAVRDATVHGTHAADTDSHAKPRPCDSTCAERRVATG
jgi:hypothetical protein